VALERPKFLALQADEAEITGSETLPGYRGRKLYPFAIQQIVQVAHDSGIRRVLMKTRKENLPSQAGILKAGLRLSGEMTVITPPAIPGKMLMLRRFGTAG
ncbi:MAG: GNAT family N-acetyltransferase, partial [Acidobacteriia bacterium]|nr:GNAT family N-acetyltransferase [Terriglobia bacterium]